MKKKVVVDKIVEKLNAEKDDGLVLSEALLCLPKKGLDTLAKVLGVSEEKAN
jgi:hypothetical protein